MLIVIYFLYYLLFINVKWILFQCYSYSLCIEERQSKLYINIFQLKHIHIVIILKFKMGI